MPFFSILYRVPIVLDSSYSSCVTLRSPLPSRLLCVAQRSLRLRVVLSTLSLATRNFFRINSFQNKRLKLAYFHIDTQKGAGGGKRNGADEWLDIPITRAGRSRRTRPRLSRPPSPPLHLHGQVRTRNSRCGIAAGAI